MPPFKLRNTPICKKSYMVTNILAISFMSGMHCKSLHTLFFSQMDKICTFDMFCFTFLYTLQCHLSLALHHSHQAVLKLGGGPLNHQSALPPEPSFIPCSTGLIKLTSFHHTFCQLLNQRLKCVNYFSISSGNGKKWHAFT